MKRALMFVVAVLFCLSSADAIARQPSAGVMTPPQFHKVGHNPTPYDNDISTAEVKGIVENYESFEYPEMTACKATLNSDGISSEYVVDRMRRSEHPTPADDDKVNGIRFDSAADACDSLKSAQETGLPVTITYFSKNTTAEKRNRLTRGPSYKPTEPAPTEDFRTVVSVKTESLDDQVVKPPVVQPIKPRILQPTK